jgi:hypothetical protein
MLDSTALFGLLLAGAALRPGGELDEVVAKTNALQGFAARYDLADREGKHSKIGLYFQSPDRAAMRMETEGRSSRIGCVGGAICMEVSGDPRENAFARIDMVPMRQVTERFEKALRESFPRIPESTTSALGAGPVFQIGWGKEVTDRLDISIAFATERNHLCLWQSVLAQAGEPVVDEEKLAWDLENGLRVELSRANGFISKLARKGEKPGVSELVLEGVDLGGEPPEGIFDFPTSAPDGARDVSTSMQAQLYAQELAETRSRSWRRLARSLHAGETVWDSKAPAHWKDLMKILQAELVPIRSSGFAESARDKIDSFAEDLAARARDVARDDKVGRVGIEDEAQRYAKSLEASLAQAADKSAAQLEAPSGLPAGFERAEAMLQVEREAWLAQFKALVSEPLLAHLRERTEAALTR